MNLKDMIEKLEEIQATDINEADPISGDMNKMVQDIDDAKARDQVPSSQLTKVTKDLTGKSAQTVDQQIDRLRNSQVPAIRDIIKKADMFDDLLNGPLKSQIAGEIQKMQKNPGQDPDSDYRADRMDNVDKEIDDSIDYDLLDLQDMNEASPSAQATRYAKGSGQSAQQLQRGVAQIGQRQDVASQGAGKLASDMDRLLNSKFANQVMRMLDMLDKEEAGNMQSAESIEEALENPEVISVLKEFTADVSLPILQRLVGGDKVLAQNARIALRNIDQDKGINKRFMPAVRKLLSKLTDMLSMGGMGALAQYDQLHNQHSSEQPGVGSGAVADPDAVQDPLEYEPSEEEIAQFAVDNGMPITTDVQKKIVADMLKQKMMDKEQDKEPSEEPGERPKDNTGRPLNVQDESLDELKKLAGLSEDKGMPSKSHVMDMCKDGMTFAEMCKMHPEANKDKLKAMVDKCKEEMKESVSEAKDDMPSKSECMKLCKDGKSKKQICDMYPDCDQDKLKAMIDDCMKEMKESVSEAMSDIYGQPKELEGGVEFKQHKGNDKGQVSIEASAESMDDLHELLKLAGVEMSVDLHKKAEPEDSDDKDHDEPESHDDKEEPKDKKVMVISPNDANYSTDKEVLVNYLKDKLKKSIS